MPSEKLVCRFIMLHVRFASSDLYRRCLLNAADRRIGGHGSI